MPRSQITSGTADWFGLKTLSWPLRFIAVCFFLSIVALPVDVFPWIAPASYTLRHLAFYPVAAGAAVALPFMPGIWRKRKEFLIFAGLFGLFLLWIVLVSFLNCGFSMAVGKELCKFIFSLGIWWGMGIFYATVFFLLPFALAKRILWSGLVTVSILCMAYSMLELAWFGEVPGSESILLALNPFFRKTCFAWEWWPPELCVGRLRSLFAEPLFMSLFAVPALIFFWGRYLAERKRKMYFLLASALSILIYFSFSRTGWIILVGSLGIQYLLLEYIGFFRGKGLLYRVIPYAGAVAILSLVVCLFYVITSLMPEAHSSGGSLCIQGGIPVSETVNLGGGSLGVRKTALISEMKIIRRKPLCGYGVSSHGAQLQAAFERQKNEESEIQLWMNAGSCPMLNIYTGIGVEFCLVGVILFLGICSFPLWLFRPKRSFDWFQIAAIAALCGLLLAGMGVQTYIHVAFQLFWGVALAAASGERRNESNL